MTQFSSKPPFNDDPFPYADKFGGRTGAWGQSYTVFQPRPEYDRPQHNPTNPILVEMLSEIPEYGFNVTAELAWLDREGLFWDNYPSGAREHAIKVLSKWKAVFG